jgi:hypothetical protein
VVDSYHRNFITRLSEPYVRSYAERRAIVPPFVFPYCRSPAIFLILSHYSDVPLL